MLEKVDVSVPRTQALVLVPTRELALQTSSVLKKLGKHLAGLTVIVSTGGTDLKEDIIRLMKPCHVIVATPGRILDLANKSVADLSSCGVFVMDEADKLLSPEFVPLIDKLLSFTPDSRQILCFSATFPRTVVSFRDRWCPDAHEINLMEELTLKGVTQYYAFVDERQKVHCMAESDTRVLTNHGLLFLDEIEARMQHGESVSYGCYDVATQSLCYRPGKLILAPPPQSLIEFTDDDETQRWAEQMCDETAVSLASGHLSLRVTPGHRMYVKECDADGVSAVGAVTAEDYYVTEASQLLSAPCGCPSSVVCGHGDSPVRMLSCAQAGYLAGSLSCSADRLRAQSVLRLNSSEFGRFIGVLGVWLCAGSVSATAVQFIVARHSGCQWLAKLLSDVGLDTRFLHTACNCQQWENGTCRYAVTEPSWVSFFNHLWTSHGTDQPASATSCSSTISSRGLDSSSEDTAQHDTEGYSGQQLDPCDAESLSVEPDDSVFDCGAAAPHSLPGWALFEVTAAESRSLVEGMWRGSGCVVQDGVRCITVSSPLLREQLMQLLLHCGYTAFAARLSDVASLAGGDERWIVSWTAASDLTSNAHCPLVSRQRGVVERPYSSIRDGRVWCVDVDHPDHLIFAQRAERDQQSRKLIKLSRVVITGNCLNTLFAKLDINQVTTDAHPISTLSTPNTYHTMLCLFVSPCCAVLAPLVQLLIPHPLVVSVVLPVHHILQQCDSR